jgi:hypothetical protein
MHALYSRHFMPLSPYHEPHKQRTDHPSPYHNWTNEPQQRLPVEVDIPLRQLEGNSKALYYDDNPRELQHNSVKMRPDIGIHGVGCKGTKNRADEKSNICFSKVELIFNDSRE